MRRACAVVVLSLLAAAPAYAVDLATTCHATSSYDLTLEPHGILFDRPAPAPTRVEMDAGNLRVDGAAVKVTASEQDRLSLFERELRALVPRVRKVADQGVGLAVQAIRAEAAGMGLGAATRTELDQRLATAADKARQRIATSQSTHDWHGDAGNQFASDLAGELAPLVAADLGQQAMQAALTGDLATAAALKDRAADIATGLAPRLRARMDGLRPQIAALCPAIRRLAELQDGVRGPNGVPLDLLEVGG